MAILGRRWARLVLVGALVLMFGGLLAGSAGATEFRNGGTVVIAEGEVINDDLFVSGNRVVVNGTVNGDLWIATNKAEVNGTVNGSLFLAGQSLRFNGQLNGSLYAAGAALTLGPRAFVQRNAYFAGYALEAGAGSVVKRDLFVTGNQTLLNGEVTRNMRFGGNALEINGRVGGNVDATVAGPGETSFMRPFAGPATPPPAPTGLRIGPRARIGGRLTYRSPVEQSANIRSQPAGGVVFVRQAGPEQAVINPAATWALSWFRYFLTLLGLGALALWGLGAPLHALARRVYDVPLLSLGWGILIALAGYFAAIVALILILIVVGLLALITLGELAAVVLFGAGTAWAFGFTVFSLAVGFGSKIVIAYLLGSLVLERLAGQQGVHRVWILVVGTLIFSLLRSIPFFGGFVDVAAAVIGLGAIYLLWRDSQARQQAA